MDARSIALLEFPLVRERLADGDLVRAVPPARRGARAATDPVVVARGLDETDQARALLEERPGVGIGAAHDIGPAIERAARGGRLDPPQFLEIAETLDATARLATVARRRAPAAAARARPRAPPAAGAPLARWPAASTRPASCSTPPRRASAGCGRPCASPTTGCAGGSTRSSASELGSALQEPIVTLRNGRYVVPVKAEARARVKGIVHDASGSGQTLFIEPLVVVELGQRLARGAGRRARGGRAHPRRAVGARRRQRAAAARDARRARPVRPLGRQGAARGRDGRDRAPRPPTGPRSSSCRPAIPG